MMVGKFPFFVLHVDLPAELVDVNVHPAKTEVKFANEKQIYDVAYHAIRNALYRTEEEEKPKSTLSSPQVFAPAPKQPERVNPTLVRQYMESTIPKVSFVREAPQKSPEEILDELLTETPVKESINILEETPPVQEVMEEIKPVICQAKEPKVVGQVFDTYIICESDNEMFLIDQHAAHERMRFESLKEAYQNKEKLSQMLLSPMILNLDYKEKQTVMENLTQFILFGFDLADFGSNAIIINGTPTPVDENAIRDLILELSDAMEQQRQHPIADFEEKALDMIACKGAIKANKHLSYTEMQDLVKKVVAMEEKGVVSCPHGRPIRITFTKDEIEKLFKRKL